MGKSLNGAGLLVCLILPLFSSIAAGNVDKSDIDNEINRIRRELTAITAQRREVKENTKKDYKEHSDYLGTIQLRFKSIRADIDSLEKQKVSVRLQNDSLGALLRTETARQHQYDLAQASFRNRLVALCGSYTALAETTPPMSVKTFTTALAFLKSELVGKNIDNIEGLQRLFQIVKDLDDQTAGIQIASGPSPVPDIRGTVYRLRLGTFYEAIVDAQGLNYALWGGIDTAGSEQWTVLHDADGASGILDAVNIREGKKVPSFARLPFPTKKVYKE
jgi:hypothetical protein